MDVCLKPATPWGGPFQPEFLRVRQPECSNIMFATKSEGSKQSLSGVPQARQSRSRHDTAGGHAPALCSEAWASKATREATLELRISILLRQPRPRRTITMQAARTTARRGIQAVGLKPLRVVRTLRAWRGCSARCVDRVSRPGPALPVHDTRRDRVRDRTRRINHASTQIHALIDRDACACAGVSAACGSAGQLA
jgi:hypothetical protein